MLPKEPAGHGVTWEAPEEQKPPSPHSVHAVEPSLSWKLPAAHAMQVAEADMLVKLPGAQARASEAPSVQNEPAGQFWQSDGAVFPVASEYVPASHKIGVTAPTGQ